MVLLYMKLVMVCLQNQQKENLHLKMDILLILVNLIIIHNLKKNYPKMKKELKFLK